MSKVTRRYGSYFSAKDKGVVIRQIVYVTTNGVTKKTSVRYPKHKYKHCTSEKAINDLVIRLNRRENRRAIKEIETKLAFLPTKLKEEFREQLQIEIPNQKDARLHYRNLHRYFLSFFVEKMKMKDPIDWKSHETKWGLALVNELTRADNDLIIFKDEKNKKVFMSVKTIKGIIQTANRFMAFLHKKNPAEIPFIKFTPLSKAKLKDYGARLRMKLDEVHGKFIPDDDWRVIRNALPEDIKPFILLGYYYGLRRGETLGVLPNDLKRGYLSVERQLEKTRKDNNSYKPLKNRELRKTPHWLTGANDAFEWIKEANKKKMHPDTLGVKFMALMQKLKLDYEMHDLRRTFITRALDIATPKDVMLAVGHANIQTTMLYLRDDRILDDAIYTPKKA